MESLNYRSERVRFVKELKYKYINEFPDGTPFVVACENGRLADVESFVNNHDMKETGKDSSDYTGKDAHNNRGLSCAWLCSNEQNKETQTMGKRKVHR